MNVRRAVVPVVCLLVSVNAAIAQPRVDWRNKYERVLAIVPMIGQGTAADPRRPNYVPVVSAGATPANMSFLGFAVAMSDDGNSALVEFVATSQSAFQAFWPTRQYRRS
jgi:hypothetical protein